MRVNGIEYNLVVTSANEFEHLSLECTDDQGLILEAELVSYTDKKAKIHFLYRKVEFLLFVYRLSYFSMFIKVIIPLYCSNIVNEIDN